MGMAEPQRPVGVFLTVAGNLVFYALVLTYVMILVSNAHSYYGSGYIFVDFVLRIGVAYSLVGMLGTIALITFLKLFRYLAIAGWISECAAYSMIAYVIGSFSSYNREVYITVAAILTFKIASIAYFYTKKVKQAFHA